MKGKHRMPAVAGRSRAIYETLPKGPNIVSTQSYLRLESAALGTQGSISFNVLTNEGTPNETERRLSLTDTFTVTEMCIFLLKVTTAGTNRTGVLHTFPNATVFSGSNESANLMNIYNGYFSANVNGKILIPALDVMRFYRVGGSQAGVGLSTYDATNNANNKFLQDTFDAGSYGFYPMTPQLTLSGAWKNQLSITCPASVAMAGSSSTNYAVCYLRGYLNQNAANFQSSN